MCSAFTVQNFLKGIMIYKDIELSSDVLEGIKLRCQKMELVVTGG